MTQEKPPLAPPDTQDNIAEERSSASTPQEHAAPNAGPADTLTETADENASSVATAQSQMPEAATDAATDATHDAHTPETAPPAPAENTPPENPEPMKGVGFLGRRGTAPIHTMSAADAEKHTSSDPASEAVSSQSLPSAPAPKTAQAAPPTPGMAENSFRLMSYAGLLFLTLLLIMQTAAGVYFPTVFLPQETALVEVYGLMAQGGQWLAPPATAAVPAALPGYFWFLSGVDMLPGLADPFFLPVSAALSAFVALLGTYTLGLCTGLGKRVSFAAGLMLLSMLGFVPLTHVVGPDVLLAGLLALSLACLYRGWAQERAFLWLASGFVLAGAATLVGGFMALWIPLVASLLFIFWRGTLRRGHRLDAVLGFALLLISVASWLGAVILLTGESAAVLAPLFDQLVTPLLPPYWPPKEAWWLGLALLGVGLIPWIFIPFFVSWHRVAANAWPALKAARKENAGVAWLWLCLGCGLVLLLTCSAKPLLMAVPLLPLAVLLLAKALLHLSHTGSRLFFLLLALLCLVVGAALSAAGIPVALDALKPHLPAMVIDLAQQSAGLPLLGGVLLLAALMLVRFTNRAYPGGSLAVFVLLVTMLVQPATLLTGPSHAGKLAVYLPGGMGVNMLVGGMPVSAPEEKPATVKPEAIKSETAKPAEPDAPAAPAAPAAPVQENQPQAPTPPVQEQPTEQKAPTAQEQSEPEQGATEAPLAAPAPSPAPPAAMPATTPTAAPSKAVDSAAESTVEAEHTPAPMHTLTPEEKLAPPAVPQPTEGIAPQAQEKPTP